MRLNNSKRPEEALGAMWEVVVSAELSKLGNVDFEKDFGVNVKPDIFFSSDQLDFLADIKCISDQNKHENNRVGELQLLIYKHFCNLGLNTFSCHVKVQDTIVENRNGKSVDLKLPKDISGYFHNHIKKELKPDKFNYDFKDLGDHKGLCFSLEVRLNDQYSTAHHASYTVSEDDKNTTLYKTLDKQYKQVEFYEGFKGFIVCDGDYDLFRQRNYSVRKQYATFESVCNRYLEYKSKVGFVVGLWIENKKGAFERGYDIKFEVHCNDLCEKKKLEKLFGHIVEELPEVIRSPVNVKNLLSSKNKYGSGSIGFRGQSNKLETTYGFSLREIQSVLAGKVQIMLNDKHNLFPCIPLQEIVEIWVDQKVYKEDFIFNIRCKKESKLRIDKELYNYDAIVAIKLFVNLMTEKISFCDFERKLILDNNLQSNPFRDYLEKGYLIKDADSNTKCDIFVVS
ncbi:hypothetical protein [Acinetobacter sp. ASP199]|uniref:hypothetical protein n=1 Tax=unclassified Acinetobacter TaxID=196816 RepID=UPI001F61A455|nr:hypothetical protein [Acinetobacter sp. ASP199]